jgi:hypothetical protein
MAFLRLRGDIGCDHDSGASVQDRLAERAEGRHLGDMLEASGSLQYVGPTGLAAIYEGLCDTAG